MQRLMLGIALLAFLVLLSSCRKDPPPPIDICEGDGVGGAYCTLSDGSHIQLLPSQLKRAWIIPDQEQAKAFVNWCYNP
jgi:hypothetical protein